MADHAGGVEGASARTAYRGRIERVIERAPDLRSVFVRVENGPLPRFSPGMFISIAMPLGDEIRARPYTIASSFEDGDPFELLFNLVPGGRGSHWLFERKPGDEIGFTGPFGLFVLDQAPPAEVIFVAEGAAIAPIRPMIRKLLPHSHQVHLLYGAERIEHLVYRTELEVLQAHNRNFRIERFVQADRNALFAALSARIEQQWIPPKSDQPRQFFLCGIGEQAIALRDRLRKAGYDRRAVRYERW